MLDVINKRFLIIPDFLLKAINFGKIIIVIVAIYNPYIKYAYF